MEHVLSSARYAGLKPTDRQIDQIRRFWEWLRTEGYDAGGLGPDELDRLEQRHLADSLVFAAHFSHDTPVVWDLGSGVGLPGLPLAIVLPDTRFRLIDRSGRRADLLRRVVRILDLENCHVVEGEIADLDGKAPVMVARASLPPEPLRLFAKEHLESGGVVVSGGSWVKQPTHVGWETVEIPAEVLDQPVWLLIMRQA